MALRQMTLHILMHLGLATAHLIFAAIVTQVLLAAPASPVSPTSYSSSFIKRTCYGEGCSQTTLDDVNKKQTCALTCGRDETCSGFFYYNTRCIIYQGNCFELPCSISLLYGEVFQKYVPEVISCLNGGVWDYVAALCTCTGGWVGATCDRLANNCTDLIQESHSYPLSTDHDIQMDVYGNMSRIIKVRCHCTTSACRAYIFHNDGTGSHNKTWADYVNGYQCTSAPDNLWLGLENILAINRMGYDVVFTGGVLRNGADQYEWSSMTTNFFIYNASSEYKYIGTHHGASFIGTAFWNTSEAGYPVNILLHTASKPFSTYDREQDLAFGVNCAAKSGAGWWFTNCPDGDQFDLNPLGVKPNTTGASEKEKMRFPILNFTYPELEKSFVRNYMFFYQQL